MASIAVFDNLDFVDTAGGPAAGSDIVQAILSAQANTVSTFTATDGPGIASALAGNEIVVFFEFLDGTLLPDPAAISALQNFISLGGGLIINGSVGSQSAFLNSTVGFSLSQTSGDSATLTAGAAGTSFARGTTEYSTAVMQFSLADHGLRIAGYDVSLDTVSHPAGSISFVNVSVTGEYEKTLAFVQGYNDLSEINFDGLSIGDSDSVTGWPGVYVNPMGGADPAGNFTAAGDGFTNVDLSGLSIDPAGDYGGFAGATGINSWLNGTSGIDEYVSAGVGTVFFGLTNVDSIKATVALAPGDFTLTPAGAGPAFWTVDFGGGVTETVFATTSGEIIFCDSEGNQYDLGASATSLDMTPPTVTSVAFSDPVISDADAMMSVTLEVTFNEAMNDGIDPMVILETAAQSTLGTPTGSVWNAAADVFTLTYTVAATDVEVDTIEVTVSDAKDAGGNQIVTATVASMQDIDTTADVDNNLTLTVPSGDFNAFSASDQIVLTGIDVNDIASGTITLADQGNNSITVSTFSSGDVANGSGSGSGTFTISAANLMGLAEGDIDVRATVNDLDGNSKSIDLIDQFVLDITPPSVPTIDPRYSTQDAPTLTGTASAVVGETTTLTVAGATFAVTPDARGAWSLDLATAPLLSGAYIPVDGINEVTLITTD